MGEKKNIRRVLVQKPEEKRPLARRGYRDEINIIDFRNTMGFFEWVHLVQEEKSKRLLGKW
jgi:hypothetical protein